jgi:uncharacterized membrane protein YraQ (UPF0718 family)
MELEQALRTPLTDRTAWLAVAAFVAAWFGIYFQLTAIADALFGLTPLSRGTRLGEAVHFFLYDTPKVLLLLLLTLIVFVMGVVHTFFAPERTRALLSGRREGVGNVLSASLGIVTPFRRAPRRMSCPR